MTPSSTAGSNKSATDHCQKVSRNDIKEENLPLILQVNILHLERQIINSSSLSLSHVMCYRECQG
jgi:hypothetical protein